MRKVARGRGAWVRTAGVIVVAASAVFMLALLWAQRRVIMHWRPSAAALAALAMGIPAYGAGGLVLTAAWRRLLLWSGETAVSFRDAVRIYGRSQIAKYIPGNFAQLLGRHVIGRQRGWSHTGLALAGLLELASLLFVAAAIALIGLCQTDFVRSRLTPIQLTVLGLAALIGSLLILHATPILIKNRWPDIAARLLRCRWRDLWPVAAFHGLFFALSGSLFLMLALTVLGTPVPPSLWPALIGLLAVAWAAGVVTPGAPSGLGVRESVLTLGLANIAPAGEALVVAGLFRVITVCGDVVFFLFAGCVQTKEESPRTHRNTK